MSGLKNFIREGGQSITGAISKAIIVIHDERNVTEEITVEALNVKKKSMKEGFSLDALSAVMEDVDKEIQGKLEELTKAVPSNRAKKISYEVKFNPSQLSFQVYGGNKVAKTDLSKSKSKPDEQLKIEYVDMAPRIQMNVQLIFDDCNLSHAFAFEKRNSAYGVAKTAAMEAYDNRQGTVYSVKPQVEGFIAALRNNYTRKISFNWGKMTYSGVLTNVDAEYTMFSMEGNPIRANVNLGILCTDSTMHDDYMGQWQNSYKKVFGSGETTNLGSKVQELGNILNINL